MPKKELEQHYLNTTYSVFIDEKKYDIKLEKPLPPVIQKLVNKEKTAVILTAWNPRSQALSFAENKSRNNELYLEIKNKPVFNAVGQGEEPSWPAEESYFIPGIEKSQADIMAVKFEQYAYVWCENEKPASLIFTHLWQSLNNDC